MRAAVCEIAADPPTAATADPAAGSAASSAFEPFRIIRAVKLYTRTGDGGETSYFDGTRVRKDDPRLDAYGEIDELNAWLGFVRAYGLDARFDEALSHIQRDLFAFGAQLADPADKLSPRVVKAVISDEDVERVETLIDDVDSEVPPLRRFILPGGTPAGAALHVARTVCRRAERRLVALATPVDPVLLRYINRLSDLLFALARAVNHQQAVPETEW
jgi:cob(I)alamin adenosyltransferase